MKSGLTLSCTSMRYLSMQRSTENWTPVYCIPANRRKLGSEVSIFTWISVKTNAKLVQTLLFVVFKNGVFASPLAHGQYKMYRETAFPLPIISGEGVDWSELECLMEVSTMFYYLQILRFYLVRQHCVIFISVTHVKRRVARKGF